MRAKRGENEKRGKRKDMVTSLQEVQVSTLDSDSVHE
jgi:hypothetical protein